MLACLLAGFASGCAPEEPRSSAVLVTLDTTNPGALDCYGRDRGLTPHLAELARQSRVFENARSVAPLTLPAHTSMLTGLVPLRHGVRDNGQAALPQAARTLAERARAAGYQTAAVVAAQVLSRAFGLDQGFELYDEPAGAPGSSVEIVERPAREVTDRALDWLSGRDRDRPFLLWVHYFDAHAPYTPAPRDLRRADGNAYLGEVAGVDRELGRLLAALDEDPGPSRLVLLVVADHGESLGRHGEATHSALCYDATLRVPLLLRAPALNPGPDPGIRSVVDVFPTLLEALGLGPPGDVDGLSLLHPVPPERGVYFESYAGYLNYGWSPLAGWADARGKYLVSSRPELYRPADLGEEHDLAASRPDDVARYRSRIARLQGRPRLESEGSFALSPGLQSQLRALGYAAASSGAGTLPDPLDTSDRPAPQDSLAELGAFYRAAGDLAAGHREEALSELDAVVAANPRNAYAAELLAQLLTDSGRPEEALQRLEPLAREEPGRYTLERELGRAHEAAGRLEPALRHYLRALEILPGEPEAVQHASAVLERLGRAEEAARLRAR